MTTSVVWLKRDLRLHDHRPLAAAALAGKVIFLYVIEPEYWALKDTSFRQYRFLQDSLADLSSQCDHAGGSLTIRVGDVVKVLEDVAKTHGDIALYAHEETGNAWTFARDVKVRRWCNDNNINFTEYKQHGIARGSELDRDKWAKRWDAFMAEPVTAIPEKISWAACVSDNIPSPPELGLIHDGILHMQPAGRVTAEYTLQSFLNERGQNYRKGMSSPISAEDECSRLSPYLALGTISMREVYHAALERKTELTGQTSDDAKMWRGAMTSFIGRLHWHCHFMQKLEAEPELEWLPMARIYKGLRGDSSDADRLYAFEQGMTGYPFVDACMRYLRATGWINFRMRAMLTSFASYHLWLRWQDSGDVLARLFTDYEPGIHWPQAQMQSGETGINAIRIYSPVKQGYDQDPAGDFTRKWVPELASLEGKSVHEPWLADRDFNYPKRIVEHKDAVKDAKSKLWAIRSTVEAKRQANEVYERHGSRKGPRRRAKRR
ncbi:deoxyribodipyrimidine photo-lyase [Hellea sp.]|nr:deoxyribodipyrimidine photo-lyase [Hellea sp.]